MSRKPSIRWQGNVLNTLLSLLAICFSVSGQDLETGPPPGTVLTPVKAYANSGPFSGREFDVSAEIGEGNGALLFIHQLTRNGIPTMRALDDFASQYGLLNFKSFTLLLTDDRNFAENRLKGVNGSLKMRNPMVVCLDGPEGPGNLALNRKCVQSLLLIRQGKIVKSVALTDIAAEDREMVRHLIEEVTGPLPVRVGDYLELAKQKLPTDPEALRRLVREQSLELHRVNRELITATQGIPKYRGRMSESGRLKVKKKPSMDSRDRKKPTLQRIKSNP